MKTVLRTLTLALSFLMMAGIPSEAVSSGDTDITAGRSLLKQAKYLQAIKVLTKAAAANPSEPEIHFLLGDANYKLKRYAQAKQELVSAIRLSWSSKSNKKVLPLANEALLKLPKEHLKVNDVNAVAVIPDLFGGGTTRGISKEDLEAPRPKVLDFYADWCGPCQQLKPVVERAKKKYSKKIDFMALNADETETQEMMEKYGVHALPTLLFIGPNGKTVTYTVGSCGDENVEWSIKTLLEETQAERKNAEKG